MDREKKCGSGRSGRKEGTESKIPSMKSLKKNNNRTKKKKEKKVLVKLLITLQLNKIIGYNEL